jgi:PTH1 family peptidyl-tRNA hydrolase
MKLFVGLGNPGGEHAQNRHNVGFMAADRIAAEHGFSPWRRRFHGATAEGEIAGRRVVILKPATYMNESGQAVGEAARFLKIPESDVVVFYDEIDLPPGKLKVKTGGGNAGHNGLRSISAHLGNDYVRVRIGVGHPGSKDQVVHWVLRDFAKADRLWLDPLLDAIATSAGRLVANDQARFLSDVLTRVAEEDEPRVEARKKKTKNEEAGQEPRRARASKTPEGERAGKRQSALAENLKKWLAGRGPKS